MKETGIIMSGDYPLKCLDGMKTMTRRVVVPQPDVIEWNVRRRSLAWKGAVWEMNVEGVLERLISSCPYGGPGDILIMRETWATENRFNHLKPSELPDDAEIFYLASEEYDPFRMGVLRPSMFMPYRFSRARFEITGVGFERLQGMSEEDAYKEGFDWGAVDTRPNYEEIPARYYFWEFWDSLNAKRGYGWDANPWVWPISFRLMEVAR